MSNQRYPRNPILIVDDEPDAILGCELNLRSEGLSNTLPCQDSRDVMNILNHQEIGVVLLDLSMPHVSGQELLPSICEQHPQVPVIIVTGANAIETAVACMQAGAHDYMVKPVEKSRMVNGVRRAIELRELRDEYDSFASRVFTERLDQPEAFSHIVSNDPVMFSVCQYAEAIAQTSQPVLVSGETGVGKELFARALHELSGRKGPFVGLNVAGLDQEAFSDALFGHVKGAFTGADQPRPGFVQQAAGGTLLLDEIGDLNPSCQVKLLRLLQERRYFPLGSDVAQRTDARIVATTNRDLRSLQSAGHFRADLYYRLITHHVQIPPLRSRLGDVPLLLDHFLERASLDLSRAKPTPPGELCDLLCTYHFPGNVRELEAMVFDAVSKHKSRMLSMESFKAHIRPDSSDPDAPSRAAARSPVDIPFPEQMPTLREVSDLCISEAMRRANNKQTTAAQLLGISRPTLCKRLKQLQETCD
ncbi:MAG: sigma-54-dependent Fis family transcriptional regulator [bacterium]|nr:sigma-54-dependent Fis family transcriptional regulator [bacterium]